MHWSTVLGLFGFGIYKSIQRSGPPGRPRPFVAQVSEEPTEVEKCLNNVHCIGGIVMGGSASKPEPTPELNVIHKNQVEQSSGFHILEVHGGTAGTMTIIGLLIILLLVCCFLHHIRTQRKRIRSLQRELTAVRRDYEKPAPISICPPSRTRGIPASPRSSRITEIPNTGLALTLA